MHIQVLRLRRWKAQSAMEYLMTYGWAILIIAVVLGALFELGVFSGTFFMPHAPPGSCHVFRPYGPRTVGSINLEGECQGALPQYVAEFNGKSSSISTALTFPSGSSETNFTLSVWVYTTGVCSNGNFYCGIVDADNGGNGWGLMSGQTTSDFWILDSGPLGTQDMKFNIPHSAWTNIVVTYEVNNGNYLSNAYVNGVLVDTATRSAIALPEPYPLQIGIARESSGMVFNGSISNIQLYNASFSSNTISSLYDEGIGGAPVDLQNLVAWWPLNGNANDYSGNSNDGTASNVIYATNWENGYTQP